MKAPSELFTVEMRDGVHIQVQRRGVGQRLLFSHGTGFACAAYDPFLSLLAQQFEVISFDARGHGLTASINSPLDPAGFSANALLDDLIEVVDSIGERLGREPLWGVFHSVSSVMALRAMVARPGIFTGLLAYEPPLAGIGKWASISTSDRTKLAVRARKRQFQFDSISQLQDKFQCFKGVELMGEAEAFGIANALLEKGDDGLFRLRCPAAIEARLYETNSQTGLWDSMRDITQPVYIICGERAGVSDYTADIAVEIATAGEFMLLKQDGLSHLGWIEAPWQGAEQIIKIINQD